MGNCQDKSGFEGALLRKPSWNDREPQHMFPACSARSMWELHVVLL